MGTKYKKICILLIIIIIALFGIIHINRKTPYAFMEGEWEIGKDYICPFIGYNSS